MSAQIQVRPAHGKADVRLLQGERLVQYCEDIVPCEPNLEFAGERVLLLEGESPSRSPDLGLLKQEGTSYLETFGGDQESVAQVLELALPREISAKVTEIGASTVHGWQLDSIAQADFGVPNSHTFSLETVQIDRFGDWCQLGVHFVVCEDWCVAMWQAPRDSDGEEIQPERRVLPGTRVSVGQTRVTGFSGPSRLARFLQELLRHHEYSAEVFSACLADWESGFFDAIGELDTQVERASLVASQSQLVQLRKFLGRLDHAQRSLGRRALNQPGFPGVVRDEALARSAALADEIASLRRDTHAAYALLAGAATEEQSRTLRAQEQRMQRTSLVIGLVGGVVLWPGLVAAYYGADVTGLPGQEADTGLLVMIVASVLGAVAFGGWVLLYGRRR